MSKKITHSYIRDPSLRHRTFHYQQTTDPGAIGAEKWWLDTTTQITPLAMDLTNLISFWELEEFAGARVDSQGSNNLTDHGGVSHEAGVRGECAYFGSASSQYLDIADNASLSVGNIDFTCAGWVKYLSVDAFSHLIGQWNDTGDRSWVLRNDTDSKIRLLVSSDGTSINTTTLLGPTLANGTWYFFVCGHDAANDRIFLQIDNGTELTAAWTLGVHNSSAPFAMGAIFFGVDPFYFLFARLDQVGFWKRILTPAERTYLFNMGLGRTYAEMATQTTYSQLKYRNDANTAWITL